MSVVTNDMRIAATQFVMNVLAAVKAIKTNAEDRARALSKIREYLPKFTANLTFHVAGSPTVKVVTRYFTYMDKRRKGKKRVYVSRENNKNDLYILYIQKERLLKLCKVSPDSIGKYILSLIGNKWVITNGICSFSNIDQLMSHVIAVERRESKLNYPPHNNMPAEWRSSDELVALVSKYRSSFIAYNLESATVAPFEFTDEC